ncbi:hypothetical protein ACFXD5_29495 [Streptomyces sp. NPDC059385]|uniref:hypothetical protein n=1 Tax=Streptomyces sp. NPDC059385 TaxID=3346817 RepID=UPI0036BA152B
MNAFLKRVWIGLAATLIVSLAAVVMPDQVQIGDDGRVHLGAPSSKPSGSASAPAPEPEPTSPPLTREEVDEVIGTAVRAAGLDPDQGRSTVPAGSNLNRTGWTAVREKAAAPSEMKAICADLERQGWVLNPNPKGDTADASRSYKRGGWYLLVSTRGQTQAPSDTLTDSQTYLTMTGLQLNLSDLPLPAVTVRMR